MALVEALAVVLAVAVIVLVPVDGHELAAVRVFAQAPTFLDTINAAHVFVELAVAPPLLKSPVRKGRGVAVPSVVLVARQVAAVRLVHAVADAVADPVVRAFVRVGAVGHRVVVVAPAAAVVVVTGHHRRGPRRRRRHRRRVVRHGPRRGLVAAVVVGPRRPRRLAEDGLARVARPRGARRRVRVVAGVARDAAREVGVGVARLRAAVAAVVAGRQVVLGVAPAVAHVARDARGLALAGALPVAPRRRPCFVFLPRPHLLAEPLLVERRLRGRLPGRLPVEGRLPGPFEGRRALLPGPVEGRLPGPAPGGARFFPGPWRGAARGPRVGLSRRAARGRAGTRSASRLSRRATCGRAGALRAGPSPRPPAAAGPCFFFAGPRRCRKGRFARMSALRPQCGSGAATSGGAWAFRRLGPSPGASFWPRAMAHQQRA